MRNIRSGSINSCIGMAVFGDVAISPDGSHVVYSLAELDNQEDVYRWGLWIVSTSSKSEPSRLTGSEKNSFSPSWAPDGEKIAFLVASADKDEKPTTELWVLRTNAYSGDSYKVSEDQTDILSYSWHDDSSALVYVSTISEPDSMEKWGEELEEHNCSATLHSQNKPPRSIRNYHLDTAATSILFAGDFGISEAVVSPDSATVAYSTNRTGDDNDFHESQIWTFAVEKPDPIQRTFSPGPKSNLSWSLDGKEMFYRTTSDPARSFSQEVPVAICTVNWEARPVLNPQGVDLAADSDWETGPDGELYVLCSVGTATQLAKIQHNLLSVLSLNVENIHAFSVARTGAIALAVTSCLDAPRLLLLSSPNAKTKVIADPNSVCTKAKPPVRSEIVRYLSDDGLYMEALLLRPAAANSNEINPFVLSIHGGPHARHQCELTPNSLEYVMAAHGFNVLMPNYRGSDGYGDQFGQSNFQDLGGKDASDVLAGINWALDHQCAALGRIGLMGDSYGAYLASWIATQSDLVDAVVSQSGIASFAADSLNSAAPRWEWEYFGGSLWEQPQLYGLRSPVEHIRSVKAPFLLLHGEDDSNTFVSNAREMYNALRHNGKTASLVTYPGEAHGLSEPGHLRDSYRRTLNWFDKYLSGDTSEREYESATFNSWKLIVFVVRDVTFDDDVADTAVYTEVLVTLGRVGASTEEMSITVDGSSIQLTADGKDRSRTYRPAGVSVELLGHKGLVVGRNWRRRLVVPQATMSAGVPLSIVFKNIAIGYYTLTIGKFTSIRVLVS